MLSKKLSTSTKLSVDDTDVTLSYDNADKVSVVVLRVQLPVCAGEKNSNAMLCSSSMPTLTLPLSLPTSPFPGPRAGGVAQARRQEHRFAHHLPQGGYSLVVNSSTVCLYSLPPLLIFFLAPFLVVGSHDLRMEAPHRRRHRRHQAPPWRQGFSPFPYLVFSLSKNTIFSLPPSLTSPLSLISARQVEVTWEDSGASGVWTTKAEVPLDNHAGTKVGLSSRQPVPYISPPCSLLTPPTRTSPHAAGLLLARLDLLNSARGGRESLSSD